MPTPPATRQYWYKGALIKSSLLFCGVVLSYQDVLFADALTSMSKLLADMQIVFCVLLLPMFGHTVFITCNNRYADVCGGSVVYPVSSAQTGSMPIV